MVQVNLEPPGNTLLNDKSRASEDLLVAPAYTQDQLLQQLLSKYHEDFLSALTPPPFNTDIISVPSYRQDPLLRLLNPVFENNKNTFSPPAYKQDPLLRQLSGNRKEKHTIKTSCV